LVWYREGKGWSQKRLADEVGVDPTTLARWEREERQPAVECCQKVADLFARRSGDCRIPMAVERMSAGISSGWAKF
jgi:DNA-binding XRE family transcriptional regulator